MATTNIFNSTAPVAVGADNGGGGSNYSGRVLWVQTRINGSTLQTFFDARTAIEGSTSITDAVDNVWTLQGTSAIVAHRTQEINVKTPTARRSNILDYDNDGSDRPITGLEAIGAGEGDDMLILSLSQTNGLVPLWEGKLTFKSETEEDGLRELGEQELANRANNIQAYTLNLDPNQPPFQDDVKAGDRVRVVINDEFTQEDGIFWVGRKRVTLSKQQDENITLEVTE